MTSSRVFPSPDSLHVFAVEAIARTKRENPIFMTDEQLAAAGWQREVAYEDGVTVNRYYRFTTGAQL